MANRKNSAHVGVITPFRTHSEEKIKISDQKRSLFSLWSLYNEHWLIVAASNDLLSYMRRVKVAILITVAQQDQNGQKN